MNQVGCAPYPYNPAAAYAAPFAGPAFAAPLARYDIVGQVTPAAPATSYTQKVKNFLNDETAGLKNGYWLAGAAVVGLGIYGYQEGWFG